MKVKIRYSAVALVVLLGMLGGISAQAADKPTEIVFSTYWPTKYEYLWQPIVHFAEKVEKNSDGRVKFKLYHSGQLYKGKEEFAALERGDIDMTAPLDLYNTGIVLELGISNLPFLWPNPTSLQKTLDAGLWDLGIKDKLLKHNMVVLDVAAGGPYQVYSKNFAVTKPEDLKGKKWGVSGTTASKAVELLGGAPTTMSSGELYLALQRNTIDGCTRPLITGLGRKLYEVVDNLSITHMGYFCTFLVINKKKWDSLPEDIQGIISAAAKERSNEQLGRLNAFMDEAIALYKEKGVNVHVLSAEELAKFKEAVAPVYDWWLEKVPEGKELIDFAMQNQ